MAVAKAVTQFYTPDNYDAAAIQTLQALSPGLPAVGTLLPAQLDLAVRDQLSGHGSRPVDYVEYVEAVERILDSPELNGAAPVNLGPETRLLVASLGLGSNG